MKVIGEVTDEYLLKLLEQDRCYSNNESVTYTIEDLTPECFRQFLIRCKEERAMEKLLVERQQLDELLGFTAAAHYARKKVAKKEVNVNDLEFSIGKRFGKPVCAGRDGEHLVIMVELIDPRVLDMTPIIRVSWNKKYSMLNAKVIIDKAYAYLRDENRSKFSKIFKKSKDISLDVRVFSGDFTSAGSPTSKVRGRVKADKVVFYEGFDDIDNLIDEFVLNKLIEGVSVREIILSR
jgi:hypothetical protein